MLGAFLALLSAALFGFNNAATRRGVLNGSVIQGMAITVPMGVLLFGLACLVAGSLDAITRFSPWAIFYFSMAGIAHFVFGRYCNYRAIAAIGTNLASPIQQWEVLVTLALAVVLLGEKLTPIAVIAIGLLVLGPAIATRIEEKKSARAASAGASAALPVPAQQLKFEPRYREGYTWAFLSIFGYGASPIFVRAGLENATMSDGLAAGLVSYIAATIVVVLWIVLGRQAAHVRSLDAEPRRWFVLAGVLVFLSHMVRYMALALLPAVIVAPIMRIQALFRIYFSWILTRDYEVFDRNVIVGTVVSMAGAVLIALPPEAVAAWLPLPEWARAALAWRWP
jgi:drug/metabolite transporter (DMT)-like permease